MMAKSRGKSKDEAKRQQRRQLLKTGIAALVAIGLCSWAAYCWFNPPWERYNNFVIDSAVEWMEDADDGDFDDCLENKTAGLTGLSKTEKASTKTKVGCFIPEKKNREPPTV